MRAGLFSPKGFFFCKEDDKKNYFNLIAILGAKRDHWLKIGEQGVQYRYFTKAANELTEILDGL